MKTLKDLLQKRKAKLSNLSDKDVFYIFQKVIQEEFGNIGMGKFKADFFKNKTIFVHSDSSAWASELWNNRQKIIRKINEELGEKAVEKIVVK